MTTEPTNINIIADIAGRYDELMILLEMMPKADTVISLGDLPDRGSQTKQVIEYFMNTPNTEVIKGNHDQMMIDGCRDGYTGDWMRNGGWATIESYGHAIEMIPKEHIDWLNARPLYFDFPDVFLSHAPITSLAKEYLPARFSQDPRVLNYPGFLWNRNYPRKPLPNKKFSIHGHNSTYKEYKFGNGYVYSICLDNSANGFLNGMHWPTRQVYSVAYLTE